MLCKDGQGKSHIKNIYTHIQYINVDWKKNLPFNALLRWSRKVYYKIEQISTGVKKIRIEFFVDIIKKIWNALLRWSRKIHYKIIKKTNMWRLNESEFVELIYKSSIHIQSFTFNGVKNLLNRFQPQLFESIKDSGFSI